MRLIQVFKINLMLNLFIIESFSILKKVSPVDLHLNDSDVGLIVVGQNLREEKSNWIIFFKVSC